MTQIPRVAIVTLLTVGAGAVLCTIFIHALVLRAILNFCRFEKTGTSMWWALQDSNLRLPPCEGAKKGRMNNLKGGTTAPWI